MYEHAIEEAPKNIATSKYYMSIDYGTRNAFAALVWELKGQVWYATRGYYYSGRDTGVSKTDGEYMIDIDKLTEGLPGPIRTIVDPSAASFIALLRKHDTRYKVFPADNAVMDGIRETALAIQRDMIKIDPSIKEWKSEAGGYVWDETAGDDKPIKVNDHYMDSTRYFVKTTKLLYKNREQYNSIYM